MRTDRRGFFRLSLRLAAGALSARAWPAGAAERSFGPGEIHHATRNTRTGAVGVALRRLRSRAAPVKRHPGSERMALSDPAVGASMPLVQAVARSSGFARAPITLAQISRLLYLANGVTGQLRYSGGSVRLRAAPSAGALYAGEVYAVVERVEGVPPGIYYYAVHDHALVRLQSGSHAAGVAAALEEPHGIEGAAVSFLLTNVFERYTGRYLNRGYRYALIDSGHIGENLRLAAAQAGLNVATPRRFQDDSLNEMLAIDGLAEAVCALHAVGAPAATKDPAQGPRRRLAEKQLAAPDAMRHTRSRIERYHEATKLVPVPEAASEPSRRPGPRIGFEPQRVHSLGPPRSLPTASVADLIRERRSALRFDPDPIPLEDLGFVVAQAQRDPAPDSTGEVALLFAAHRVVGLPAGLYRALPDTHGTARLKSGDLSEPLTRACLGQEKAGLAAVAFLMVADLSAGDAEGGRRYRDLLIDAGAIGQRIYLSAEAVGLAARNLAAFLDDDLDRLLGLETERVIHLTLLGRGE